VARSITSKRSVTSKVCAILDAVCAAPAGLSATALGRRLGMPLSTAHRLAGELVEWGGLERQPDGRYCVGLRLWEIAATAPRATSLRDAARPYLEDLYGATGQNVQLAVRDGDAALVIEHFATREAVQTATRIGGRLPLHASAVGQVLLAFAPRADQEELLARPLHRFTEWTVTAPGELRRALAEVRRTGFAVASQTMPLPATAVAAPIIGPDGQTVAAMAVVVPVGAGQITSYGHAVATSARGVSRELRNAGAAHDGPGHTRTPATDSGANRSSTS
jgi:DNA-binding IclR family transcriptional regulator